MITQRMCLVINNKSLCFLFSENKESEAYFIFVDPCEDSEHPGWPLRNFLFLIYMKW